MLICAYYSKICLVYLKYARICAYLFRNLFQKYIVNFKHLELYILTF